MLLFDLVSTMILVVLAKICCIASMYRRSRMTPGARWYSTSTLLKRAASHYGMRYPDSFARRFVAGETLEEAIAAVRQLEAEGLTVTVDRLGEKVEAREAALAGPAG